MKLSKVCLRNFRRLENVEIDFENTETVFVGPNNSGKTSATVAFRRFLNRSEFQIHDFSVSQIAELNNFGYSDDNSSDKLPSIEMDIWFSIDPTIEYGRIAELLSTVSVGFEYVGIRLKYSVKDPKKLKSDYQFSFPKLRDGKKTSKKAPKNLSHYLSLPGNLSSHFSLTYQALESKDNEVIPTNLKDEDGKRVLQSLIRVDFVDAQRNLDDKEQGRSSRLSDAFSTFYKKNLKQAEANEKANAVIDENNDSLTKHYDEHFHDLMGVIRNLGVPSVNDREMRLVSSLSPEEALKGNTSLLYIDPILKHELPEAYNGLGFKNLVYMAIQISHFHQQWLKTEEKQPLCQMIFIEEPEVHLHAQVQQTFIMNIWNIVQKAAQDNVCGDMVPQLVITTHSSHIIDTVEFEKIRYFQRCYSGEDNSKKEGPLNSSKVFSLRNFRPQKDSEGGNTEDDEETLNFLRQYLKLPHCDLFFADAAVLIEGTAEKLLMPKMIDKTAPGLKRNYLSILEVGGAYAHRFADLFDFLCVPYLVITDLDSVDPMKKRVSCRADSSGAVTSNASLQYFVNKSNVDDLISITETQQVLFEGNCFVTFQKPTSVDGHSQKMCGRTFEETFVYTNIQLFRDGKVDLGADFSSATDFESEYALVYDRIKSTTFKKTKFALDVSSSIEDWRTPDYIKEGLVWLEKRLSQSSLSKVVKKK